MESEGLGAPQGCAQACGASLARKLLCLACMAQLTVYIATALDIAAGLALIGALIGANFAGTD